MNFPRGAHDIAQARDNGQRPADPVIVSFVGPLREVNPVVEATGNHDWLFLADLDVIVWMKLGIPHLQAALIAIARVARSIQLWDCEAKRGWEIWPVWRGLNVPEVVGTPLPEHSSRAVFVRWGRITWWPAENARFACA